MVKAVVLNFVTKNLHSRAVLALLGRQVFITTRFLHFNKIIFEALMLSYDIAVISQLLVTSFHLNLLLDFFHGFFDFLAISIS